MSLFLLQHEELTITMLDHMVEVNNLEAEMEKYSVLLFARGLTCSIIHVAVKCTDSSVCEYSD